MLLLRWTKLIVSDSRPRNPECCTPLPSQLGNRETHATVHFDQWFGCLEIGYPETFKSNGISSLNHCAHCPFKKMQCSSIFIHFQSFSSHSQRNPFGDRQCYLTFHLSHLWRNKCSSSLVFVGSSHSRTPRHVSCYGAVAFARCHWKNVIFAFGNCETTGSRSYPLNRLHSTMC